MRKFLALFGTLAVTTSSVGFLSDNFLANKHTINNETKDLTETKIDKINTESQSWNDEKIDETLKHSLQYHDNQLSIDKKKLNPKKLPTEVANHLDLALSHLNDAVNDGYIKVAVNNNEVQLIYPTNAVTFKSTDNSDIIYFDNKPKLTNYHSSYMWYTAYGPSHWWQFWKWGGYIHFGETAVFVANIINTVSSFMSIGSIFKNIAKITLIVDNTIEASESSMEKVSTVLGGVNLASLGTLTSALVIIKTIVSFANTLAKSSPWIIAALVVITTIIDVITHNIVKTDKGNGVKWQWPCFIIPGKISTE